MRKCLINRLRAFKRECHHWNGQQQQLYIALKGKRGLSSVCCCLSCLEEAIGVQSGQLHHCGERVVEVQIREPKKVSEIMSRLGYRAWIWH